MKTKYVLEFGCRGGAHVDNQIIPSLKLGAHLAAGIVAAFENTHNDPSAIADNWTKVFVKHRQPRCTWQSATHFVSLSKLDGVDRGAASAHLWRKSA
jgi:hypothetical protein